MPSGVAMSTIAFVIWMSACEGVGSPDGWLCTRISAVADMQVAAQMLAMRCRPTDVVFTVGAGDITAMGAVILHALGARHNLGDR